ncbi:DUF3857 domain-containing protein [Acidobacteria bacterium AB60]|nr:DUF3857 domain-containing protein [Acidobacteria bacterium AB60]
MRIGVIVRGATLCLFLASPFLGRAQFQEPTKEELAMTSDPKAPGAAAVYLYREETADDALHYHSYYERIKVLTEKGKELATVHVPYEHGNFKVTDIKGRTIHADGTVIPLTAKPTDLVEVKTKGFQVNTMVFTLPNVEVGSILEYRLQLRYEDNWVSSPTWDVMQPYFVHKAHYFFNPSHSGYITNSRGQNLNRLMWALRAGKDDKVMENTRGQYVFDVTDVPPIPSEDWMPPLNSLNWKVKFYYTQYNSGADFWMNEGKHWLKEADEFAAPTNTLRQAAGQIVSAGDTDEQKAHKLYDAVMKLENTSFTRQKSGAEIKREKIKQVKDATAAWEQKRGSSDDLALLYVALARAAGLQAWPMAVVDRNRALFDPEYLDVGQLDDYIAIVKIGDKDVYLDPGEKMCPFGLLHWKHSYAGGLRGSAGGPGYGTTPPPTYTQSVMQRIGDLYVEPDGSVRGTVRYVLSGQEALHWRQLTLRNDEDEVKKQFDESLRESMPDGVQATFDHFLALDDYSSNLIAVVKINGSLATATGKRFFLPGLFFSSHAKHPFVEEKRTVPVDVKYARTEKDDVTYHLPEGYSVESGPQTASIPWPNHATLQIKAQPGSNSVEIARTLAYNFTVLDPKDYDSLHDFYQKVAAADQQQLVLTRTAVAKGN